VNLLVQHHLHQSKYVWKEKATDSAGNHSPVYYAQMRDSHQDSDSFSKETEFFIVNIKYFLA